MTVYFTLNGQERSVRTAIWNANFARAEVQRMYPGAVVGLILAERRR